MVPGHPQHLGYMDWVQCQQAAVANNATFFGTNAWESNGWHFSCILVRELYSDVGDKFVAATGETCRDMAIGGKNSGNGDFMASFAWDGSFTIYAIYKTKSSTKTWARVSTASSNIVTVSSESSPGRSQTSNVMPNRLTGT